jgi:cell division protein FtsB
MTSDHDEVIAIRHLLVEDLHASRMALTEALKLLKEDMVAARARSADSVTRGRATLGRVENLSRDQWCFGRRI